MLKIFVFEAVDKENMFGFTLDESGSNLPKTSRWSYFKTIYAEKNEAKRIALDTKEMFESIEQQGYYIHFAGLYMKLST